MSEEFSLEIGEASVESLFPLELRFEGSNGHPSTLTRRKETILLSVPDKEIEVSIPHTSGSAAQRALKAVCNGNPEFEEYLRLLSRLPEGTHSTVLSGTYDIVEDSCQVLDFLGKLYQEDYKWREGSLWLVDKRDDLLFVKPTGPRKARVGATELDRYNGRESVRELSLSGMKPENVNKTWSLKAIPYSAFETAARGLEEEDYDEISEAVKCAGAYKSRRQKDGWFDSLKKGLSREKLQDLKKKAEGIQRRRKREEQYGELYEEFERKRYKLLPDKNELLLHPKCVVSFGVDVKIRKIKSEKLEYHIGSRIHTGKWPPSVEFEPRDEFYDHEVRKLRESVREAVDNIPDGPASRLRAHIVDWILSESA